MTCIDMYIVYILAAWLQCVGQATGRLCDDPGVSGSGHFTYIQEKTTWSQDTSYSH